MRHRVMLVRERDGSPRVRATGSAQLAEYIRDHTGILDLDREGFGVFHLSVRREVIGWEMVSVGSLVASIVHPREVFKGAILASADSIVLFHNHPSGDPGASAEDRAVTERLTRAGQILGIDVLDHIIVGEDGWMSLRGADDGRTTTFAVWGALVDGKYPARSRRRKAE